MSQRLDKDITKVLGIALSSILVAPLNTIAVSLQLSVLGHKNLYGVSKEYTQEGLMKIPTEITVRERQKYELMLKVGSLVRLR